jgi:hypothetical protein
MITQYIILKENMINTDKLSCYIFCFICASQCEILYDRDIL